MPEIPYEKEEGITSILNTTLRDLITGFNPFLADGPILYSLKTPENKRFSNVYREYKMATSVRNELNLTRLKASP